MQATAMGKSLSSDIDKLKLSLETSEKHRQRLEAVFDNEKQTATDLKRQLKLDQVTLQQTLNENSHMIQSQRAREQQSDEGKHIYIHLKFDKMCIAWGNVFFFQ